MRRFIGILQNTRTKRINIGAGYRIFNAATRKRIMAEPLETIHVDSAKVSCDGGGGALGHPRVYLHIKPGDGEIECPYCSRRYVLKEGATASADAH